MDEESEVLGRNCRFLQGPGTDHVQVDRLRSAITHRQDISTVLLNYRKNGEPFYNALQMGPLPGTDNRQFFFGCQTDVTDMVLRRQEALNMQHQNCSTA